MPQSNKIKRFPAVLSGLLFLSVGILKILVPYEGLLHSLVFVYGSVIFFGIIFCWYIYIERSILSAKTRRLMLSVVFFMLIYILVGVAKHGVFLDGDFAGRFLWYLYYLPQIFATFLAFIIAYRVGRKEEYRLPKIFYCLFAFGAVIVAGYLTNDIHQLAFSFNLDYVAWDQQYTRGPLFYISTAWIYFFLIAGVIMLSVKCRAVNKKKAWLPIFWLALGSLYIVSDYILVLWDVAPFNLPETHCFIVIAMLESSIRIGILPSNSAYGEIVTKSSAAFQIADTDNNVIYRSDNAVVLSDGQMEKAKKNNVMIDENTILLSDSITGGYVYWTENITAVNEMNERLSHISESLSEEGDLLRAENELREQRAKIAEQTRLYDSISLLVTPQLEKISRLIDAEGDFDKNMAHICILNCYVKRRSNLALLKDRRPSFSSEELYLSLKESSEYIKLYGGVSEIYADGHIALPADVILLCFDLWQGVIEDILPELYALVAKISFTDCSFTFRIAADTEKELSSLVRLYGEAERLGGRLSLAEEDGTVYITLTMGGEAVG
ncbi:MAG: hypothetical protein IKA56_02675 [Clostridia bacterium]|nr:hypothetical protein [Clostridia bacterium]